MPTRAQIKFIEWWGVTAGPDGLVTREQVGDVPIAMQDFRAYSGAAKRDAESGRVLLWGLNPAGRDLVETAKVSGVPEYGDDEHIIDCRFETVCETCDGKREIPIIGDFANPCPDCGHMDADQREAALAEIEAEMVYAFNPWVTERGAMLDFLREAGANNRRVECQWDRGNSGPRGVGGRVLSVFPDDDQPVYIEDSCGGHDSGWWCALDPIRSNGQGWISAVRYESSTASSNPSSATV